MSFPNEVGLAAAPILVTRQSSPRSDGWIGDLRDVARIHGQSILCNRPCTQFNSHPQDRLGVITFAADDYDEVSAGNGNAGKIRMSPIKFTMDAYPIRFRPVFKRTIWGGRRLADQLGKSIGPESDYAESWEVVDHGSDQSVVDGGPLDGKTLNELIADHGDWLLGENASNTTFPLLLKYLDCNRVLSVQVHPDDAYGATMPVPDLGKTEAWYIVAAEPDSQVYAGLRPGVDRAMLQEAITTGQSEQVLHAFHPEPGDVIYIPAGTVHALGAGLLVAEIQQSSDTTFRLFDWNRVDADGNARPLHLEQGLEVSDYESGPVEPRRYDPTQTGWQTVVQSEKFLLRLLVMGTTSIGGDGKFHIVTVPQGSATLVTDSESIVLRGGQTVLLPAAMARCELTVAEGGVVMGMCLPEE